MWYELFINGEDLPVGSVDRQNLPLLEDFLSEYGDLGKITSYEIREWLSSCCVVEVRYAPVAQW